MKALCSEGVANHNNRVMRCASRGARRSVRRSLQATQAELEDQQERLSYAGKSLKPGFRPQGDAPVVHGDQFINYGNLGSAGRGSSGDRSLPRRPFPRSRSRRARARRKAHAGRVGPAIRQVEQERLRGCGSDCRSRAAADDAVRCHQERDSTRSPGSAPCEGSLDRPEDWRDQSASRVPSGARDHSSRRTGASQATDSLHPRDSRSRSGNKPFRAVQGHLV